CVECKTSYHPAYFVRGGSEVGSVRQYYAGIPRYIQASETHWVEQDLAIHWTLQMTVQHASSVGIAEVYNLELVDKPWHGNTKLLWRLDHETVWDTFWMFALLRDIGRRSNETASLELSNRGNQKGRIDEALAERNRRMVGTGQPMWGHVCDSCLKVKKDEVTGKAQYYDAIVLDGVSVRCRCCSVASDEDGMPCLEGLQNTRDRFCVKHAEKEWECFVRTCNKGALRQQNSRACDDPAHQLIEKQEAAMAGQGHRELIRRAARYGRAVDDQESRPQVEDGIEDCKLPNEAKKRGKLTMSSKFTHCDMLALRDCGIIIARSTFYGAEGSSLPSVFVYDKACHVLEHLFKCGDDYLTRKSAHVLDVFHGAGCHKESDEFCNKHCNPALFPELLDEHGKLIFNTSVCEQTNVWYGGFVTMVRGMSLIHFTFFLDEAVIRHNERVAMNLRQRGFHPMVLPLSHWEGNHV
ncbi:hypothetical protein BDZ89DRAFT_968722, partial [Hymenopellis radicata]